MREKKFITGSRERNARPAYDQAVTEGMTDPKDIDLKAFQKMIDHYPIPTVRIGPFVGIDIDVKCNQK